MSAWAKVVGIALVAIGAVATQACAIEEEDSTSTEQALEAPELGAVEVVSAGRCSGEFQPNQTDKCEKAGDEVSAELACSGCPKKTATITVKCLGKHTFKAPSADEKRKACGG